MFILTLSQRALNKDRCIIHLYIKTLHYWFKDNMIVVDIRYSSEYDTC